MSDSRTKLLGLIGDPVEHSLSPRLHNFLLQRAGLNYRYLAFRVERGALRDALSGMKALGIRGLNVTIPHKEAVIPLLDALSPEAEAIGAVNVIVNSGGVLTGTNTDAWGFLRSLEVREIPVRGGRAVVIGAGGAAAAVAYALLSAGAEVAIVNRTPERARALARRLSRFGPVEASPPEELAGRLRGADLLVNATPVGMWPDVQGTPVPAPLLREGLTVYDVVYNPTETRLLREAKARGCRVIGGMEMLVRQGVKALEIWTGHRFGEGEVKAAMENLKEDVRG